MSLGKGPWARLFATAVVPDEGSSVAEHGRRLHLGLEWKVEHRLRDRFDALELLDHLRASCSVEWKVVELRHGVYVSIPVHITSDKMHSGPVD